MIFGIGVVVVLGRGFVDGGIGVVEGRCGVVNGSIDNNYRLWMGWGKGVGVRRGYQGQR